MDDDRQSRRLAVLQGRLAASSQALASARHAEGRYPWLRLAALVIGLIGAYLGFSLLPFPLGWLSAVVFLALFVLVTLAHRRVIAQIEQLEALQKIAAGRAARAQLDWQAIPPPLAFHVPTEHPFDRDILVTGERSLHHLLDCAASAGGSRLLASWLLAEAPDPPAVERRQAGVKELLALPAFRLKLMMDGALIRGSAPRWEGAPLEYWLGQETNSGFLKTVLVILGALAAVNIGLFAAFSLGGVPPYFIATFLAYFALQAYTFRESSEVFGEAHDLSKRLGQLRQVLREVEYAPLAGAPVIRRAVAPVREHGEKPSVALPRIGLIAAAASLHQNPLLSLALNALVPWDLFFAYQLDRFKHALRGSLPAWLEAWYELEALVSLAEFAYLNPGYAFPVVTRPAGRPVFTARQMGHPLISAATRVCNDFTFNELGETGLISGSNMSGKSTFLRTAGANIVLAFAGAPTCASQLSAVPFRLFASMNVYDSLADGISYFYAEVRRLKALLDALETPNQAPLFFLIDEIFRGTNNRERRAGSEAYLGAVSGRQGVGLISTHDLDLVRLADENPSTRNYHFREEVSGDRMVFDFRLRAGPSPTTNALRIMALAGLPIETPGKENRENP